MIPDFQFVFFYFKQDPGLAGGEGFSAFVTYSKDEARILFRCGLRLVLRKRYYCFWLLINLSKSFLVFSKLKIDESSP